MAPEITIRAARTPEDYRACQDVQRGAWGLSDESYVLPVATMVGAQLHGGLVLIASLATGEPVGMSFAFLGRIEGRVCLYSQLTGTVAGYRGLGIGARLKHAQRAYAREEGIACVAWAFDPLQAGNAHFNLAKLGASSSRYVPDMYGARTDALNRGTPTDRLIAVWETSAEPPRPALPELMDELPRWLGLAEGIGGWPVPVGRTFEEPVRRGLLEIPGEFNRLRESHPELADRWRAAVRDAFAAAFSLGLRAVGFVRHASEGTARGGAYVLEA